MLSLVKLIDNLPALPFKEVNNIRSFTYAENLVTLFDYVIQTKSSGTFIATDDNPVSTKELLSLISKYLGRKIHLFNLPKFVIKLATTLLPRKIDSLFGSLILDSSKTKKNRNKTSLIYKRWY